MAIAIIVMGVISFATTILLSCYVFVLRRAKHKLMKRELQRPRSRVYVMASSETEAERGNPRPHKHKVPMPAPPSRAFARSPIQFTRMGVSRKPHHGHAQAQRRDEQRREESSRQTTEVEPPSLQTSRTRYSGISTLVAEGGSVASILQAPAVRSVCPSLSSLALLLTQRRHAINI